MNQREGDFIEVVEGQTKLESEESLGLLERIVSYNNGIRDHLACYSTFKPLNGILIRFFRRMPVVLDGDIVMDLPMRMDYAEVKKIASSGHRYTVREVDSKFRFDQRAVIVSLPSYQTSLEVGMEVITNPVMIQVHKFEDTVYADYVGAFVHPSSNLILPPSEVGSPHFGYAIVDMSFIKGYNES